MRKKIIAGILLILAVFFIVYGIYDGGLKDVGNKAKMICYECIGLG